MLRAGLIAILLVGLTVTTPVTCVCAPAEHGGMAIHPLFPHTHPSDAADHEPHHASATSAGEDVALGTSSPNIAAQSGASAASLASGAISMSVASPWRMIPMVLGPTWTPPLPVPMDMRRPPPGPPPR